MIRFLPWLLVMVGVLTACTSMSRRGAEDPAAVRAYEARARVLAPIDRWEIDGRLAVTDGREGGSGSLIWEQDGQLTRMSFRGAFGKGSWMLEADAHGAVLDLADGRTFAADGLAELVRQHIGWDIPVQALTWWVRGLVADAPWQQRHVDENGRLLRLLQSGWEVEFSRYRDGAPAPVPARLIARRDDHAVKLVVRGWQFITDQ